VRALGAMAIFTLFSSCRPAGDAANTVAHVRAAMVRGLGGKVELLRSTSADWTSATDGASLFEDDRMRTFKGAWAQLAFEGGSSLRVGEESLIAFGGGIVVERGTVEGELASGLRLKTPAIEAEAVSSRDIGFR
jgi:hypothetical protein